MTVLRRTLIAAAFLACSQASFGQLVVGADSPTSRYNRLGDLASRNASGVAPATPNAFGTAAVGAGVTFYDARFRRVAATDRNHPLVEDIAELLRGLSPAQQLSSVQAEVGRRVRWAHDLDTMKVADFWANAGETLERGAGDSADIAIVKMQALRAAGWHPRDLYISLGRHRQAGTHVVLLARTPGGFMVLDDRSPTVMPAVGRGSFTPVLTLGHGKSWVHGRRIASSASASGRAAAR